MGQGALVVTEPHAELNAGLIVIFRSSHRPLFDWHAWSLRFRSSLGSVTDEELKDEASNLAAAFWDRIGEFLMRTRTASELSPDEKALWIQSGLAVSPLMYTRTLTWYKSDTYVNFVEAGPRFSGYLQNRRSCGLLFLFGAPVVTDNGS